MSQIQLNDENKSLCKIKALGYIKHMAGRKAYHTDKGVNKMNWSEAIKAMAEGKKVRASNWLEGAYISATGQDDIGTGEYYNLVLNATWELYDEPERELKPEISEFDKLTYGMFVEVLQTIANHCKDLTK